MTGDQDHDRQQDDREGCTLHDGARTCWCEALTADGKQDHDGPDPYATTPGR